MHPAGRDGSDGQRVTGTMAVDLAPRGDGGVSRSVDRRTLLPQHLQMTAAAHFMTHGYERFNAPFRIKAP